MNDTNSDGVLAYMRLMIEESVKKNLPFTRQDFKDYGKNLPLYPGVKTWFDRINAYGALHNIKIEHYIISSGLNPFSYKTAWPASIAMYNLSSSTRSM